MAQRSELVRRAAKRFLPAGSRNWLRHVGRDARVRRMLALQDLDVRFAEEVISPSDGVVIDVGAERGEVSRHFAERGFAVLAFEPASDNRRALVVNSWRQALRGRIKAFAFAVSDHDGQGSLDVEGVSWGHALSDAGGQAVRVIRLGPWLVERGVPKVALLKVDTEGNDIKVLEGYWSVPDVPEPVVAMVEFSRGTLGPIVEVLRSHGLHHLRIICRWNEQPDRPSQLRWAVIDGLDELALDAEWGNVLASGRPFRTASPLVVAST